MRYYQETADNHIVCVGEGYGGDEISETQYRKILDVIHSKPTPPSGYEYALLTDLTWELVELPPMPEPELTDEEALEIILGGGEA